MGRTRNNSSQESSGSIQQINTPRDLFTLVNYFEIYFKKKKIFFFSVPRHEIVKIVL
jgi:hypothetical protein